MTSCLEDSKKERKLYREKVKRVACEMSCQGLIIDFLETRPNGVLFSEKLFKVFLKCS